MNIPGEGFTEDELFVAPLSDPTNVSTTSPSPGSVEQSSAAQDVAQPVTDDELSGEETEELPEFDPRYRQAFEGLLYIGKTTKTFRWLGHTFVLRSPTTSDLLEAGQLHKPWVGTVSDIKAWQSIMVAASLQSLDGQPLTVPLTDDTSALAAKFQYVMDHWYPWTIDKVYEQYVILDREVQQVLDAMGKA